MQSVTRFDIKIDFCPTCGGVWLDKGELEKIISTVQGSVTNDMSNAPLADFDNQPKNYGNYQNQHHKPHKKENFITELFDIF